jgi:hypothetical protein
MRNIQGALDFGHEQVTNPTQSWKGLCQSFVRNSYGVPAWAASAYDAWLRIPDAHKSTGPIESAPRGAAIYYKRNHPGQERPGHVVLATKANCLSNDIYRSGMIDVSARDIFMSHWNMKYLGWSLWTPYGTIKGR